MHRLAAFGEGMVSGSRLTRCLMGLLAAVLGAGCLDIASVAPIVSDRRITVYDAATWTPLGSLIYDKDITVIRGDAFLSPPLRENYIALASVGATTPFSIGEEQRFVGPGLRLAWSRATNQVAVYGAFWTLYTTDGRVVTGSSILWSFSLSVLTSSLSWSPDGTRFVYDREDGLWLISADGSSNNSKIPNTIAGDRQPVWSPVAQSTQIAFDCGGNLCLISTDGSGRRSLANNGTEPDWAPDGGQLVYIEREGTARHVAAINADGTNPHRIRAALASTENPFGDTFRWPHWSPDGTKVVTSGGSVWVMNVDGSGFTAVLPHTEKDVLRFR